MPSSRSSSTKSPPHEVSLVLVLCPVSPIRWPSLCCTMGRLSVFELSATAWSDYLFASDVATFAVRNETGRRIRVWSKTVAESQLRHSEKSSTANTASPAVESKSRPPTAGAGGSEAGAAAGKLLSPGGQPRLTVRAKTVETGKQ